MAKGKQTADTTNSPLQFLAKQVSTILFGYRPPSLHLSFSFLTSPAGFCRQAHCTPRQEILRSLQRTAHRQSVTSAIRMQQLDACCQTSHQPCHLTCLQDAQWQMSSVYESLDLATIRSIGETQLYRQIERGGGMEASKSSPLSPLRRHPQLGFLQSAHPLQLACRLAQPAHW